MRVHSQGLKLARLFLPDLWARHKLDDHRLREVLEEGIQRETSQSVQGRTGLEDMHEFRCVC
ncbi:MAG: hypothetical protein JRH16_20960 [Deltaproteobacteria bacterium]|nr:hypothetical protein [Deltaproteobacteria bacterium]MBW2421036.1 hypothetical protein [Deltaproteobacteria bacterium]